MPWVRLIESSAVPPSSIIGTNRPGLELIVWRTAAGTPAVADARCPHQWTHLAAEGVVEGDELLCVAHFWRFTPSGEGSTRDSTGHRSPVACLPSYPTEERDGAVWADLPEPRPRA